MTILKLRRGGSSAAEGGGLNRLRNSGLSHVSGTAALPVRPVSRTYHPPKRTLHSAFHCDPQNGVTVFHSTLLLFSIKQPHLTSPSLPYRRGHGSRRRCAMVRHARHQGHVGAHAHALADRQHGRLFVSAPPTPAQASRLGKLLTTAPLRARSVTWGFETTCACFTSAGHRRRRCRRRRLILLHTLPLVRPRPC